MVAKFLFAIRKSEKKVWFPDFNLSSQVACSISFSKCVCTGTSAYEIWPKAMGCICIFAVFSFGLRC